MKRKIAIVAGGDTSEYEVSLRRAKGIYSFIDSLLKTTEKRHGGSVFTFPVFVISQRVNRLLVIQNAGNVPLTAQCIYTQSQVGLFPANHGVGHVREKRFLQKGKIGDKAPADDAFHIAFGFRF